MADEKGNIDMDKVAEFKPTMELRRLKSGLVPSVIKHIEKLQQKWVNELGEYEWRDIPLVIE